MAELLDTGEAMTSKVSPVAPPIYYAALLGFKETVLYLHSQGAALNGENGRFGSALGAAAAGHHYSVIEYLIEHGANVKQHLKVFGSALGIAVYNWGLKRRFPMRRLPFPAAIDEAENPRKVMKVLIEAGADLGRKDLFGRTALYSVVGTGDVDDIEFLLDHGAEIDSKDSSGGTPLIRATCWGQVENAEHLLRRGANACAIAVDGESVLISACRQGYGTIVEMLLKRGADIQGRFRGRQSLHWAAIEAQNPHPNADSTAVITILIHHGAVPDEIEEPSGKTSLSLAAESGSSANVEALCAAKVNTDIQDALGQTALHLAAINRQPYIVEVLLSHGADPCIYDRYGRAPIHWAFGNQHLQTILHPSHTGGPAYEDYDKERETLHGYIVSILHDIESCRDPSRQAWIMLGKLLYYANDHEEACTAYEQFSVASRVNIKLREDIVCQRCFDCIHRTRKYHVCCRCPNLILCAGQCFQEFKRRPLHPNCEGYEYLEFPSAWWSLILEGKVKVRGETLTEWLERLRNTYGTEQGTLPYR